MKIIIFRVIRNLAFFMAMVAVPAFSWADMLAARKAYDSKDFALALKELKPLVEEAYPEAQTLLGTMYANGYGVEKDDEAAATWYLKAALQGNTEAQIYMSEAYATGRGTYKDDIMSDFWNWKAATAFAAASEEKFHSDVGASFHHNGDKHLGHSYVSPTTTPDKVCEELNMSSKYARDIGERDGSASAMLLIDAEGKILESAMLISSGSASFDKDFLQAYNKCTWVPATVDGKPVIGMAIRHIIWVHASR